MCYNSAALCLYTPTVIISRMTTILTGNYKPNRLQLSSNATTGETSEKQYFDQGFEAITTLYDRFGSAGISEILKQYKSIYLTGAEMAKAEFKGATFGGEIQNSGFSMQMIRAATVLTQGASTPTYTWTKNITSTGFQAFFGSKDSNLSTGIVATSPLTSNSVAYTQDNVVLMFTHLLSHTPPKFDEILPGIGSTNYPIFVTTYERISDLYVTQLPGPYFIPLNSQFYLEGNFQRLGTEDTQLLGVQFVRSSYAFNK